MFKNSLSAALLLVVLASCKNKDSKFNFDEKSAISDADSSYINVKKNDDGTVQIVKQNTNFDLMPYYVNGKENLLLLKIVKNESLDTKTQKNENQIAVNSQSLSKDFEANAAIKVAATEVDYSNKYLKALYAGDDNHEDSYENYSLTNGNLLMRYTYKDYLIMLPNNSEKRIVGYLSKATMFENKMDEKTLGEITYASSENTIDKYFIKAKQNIGIGNFTPDMYFVASDSSGAKLADNNNMVILASIPDNFTPKDIKDFAIQINYRIQDSPNVYSVIIPIENDKLAIEKAIFDKRLFELVKA